MGFNTVVLILNDYMHNLRESPKTLTYAITYPPNTDRADELEMWWRQVEKEADRNGERRINRNALKVMPTFHMSDRHVLLVGGNMIERPDDVEDKGNMVYVNCPEWWSRVR